MNLKALLLAVSTLLLLAHNTSQAADRPNFLLIVADDLCYRDFGFVGNKDVYTPNIDQLSTEGIHLTGMFTPAPTCSPLRHALYTGLFSIRSGAYPNHTFVKDGTKSIFTHLKEIGYRVALQNKTHVNPKASFPYEYFKGADNFKEAKNFFTRDPSQPWMMVFASNDPHSPWTRGPRERYIDSKLTVPPYLHDNAITRKLLGDYYAEISMLDGQVGQLMKLLKETNQHDNTMVVFVSEQGSSFPYGGKWNLYDNGIRTTTIVRWPGKIKAGSVNKALMQYIDIPPTFLAAAGVDPTTIDTGCPDATGNRGFDGRNVLGVWQENTPQFRDYVYAQNTTVGVIGYKEPYPSRSVRDNRYKYIRNLAPENTFTIAGIHKGQPIESWQEDAKNDKKLAAKIEWLFHRPGEELYDLDNDPYEEHNLAGQMDLASTKERLSAALDAWMVQQMDKGLETEKLAKERQGKAGKGKKGKDEEDQ